MRARPTLLALGLLAGAVLLAAPRVYGGEKKGEAKEEAGKGLKVEGELTADDPKEGNKHVKIHPFKMEAGKTYVIDMVSKEGDPKRFDPYLRLQGPTGNVVAEDDDGGGFPNAQITYKAEKDGTYKIVATTFLPGMTGKYRLTAAVTTPTALTELKAMQNEFRNQVGKVLTKGFTAEAKAKVSELGAEYITKLDKFAEAHKDDPAAKMAQTEIKQLIPQLVQLGGPAVSKLVRSQLAKAMDNSAKAQMTLLLGKCLRNDSEAAYQQGQKDKAAKIAAEAEDVLAKATKDFGDVPGARQEAENNLFLLQKLSVGKPAVDIAGEDISGKKLKLSDYRGKVVVVDFWASWCGPCVAMIPHEKELVKRMKDRPFAFIGVNADNNQDTAKAYIEKQAISWPNIFDGRGGPIHRDYHISYWPTIYVLDTNGVIRFRDVRGEDMDRAVEELLKEARAEKK
jgi:thiol-disulfide isomerase/thioredoxin